MFQKPAKLLRGETAELLPENLYLTKKKEDEFL